MVRMRVKAREKEKDRKKERVMIAVTKQSKAGQEEGKAQGKYVPARESNSSMSWCLFAAAAWRAVAPV